MPVSIFERRRLTRAAFGVAFALVFAAGGYVSKAHAQSKDDEEVEDTADTKFVKSFLKNLGLQDGTEKGIDYHERSPLVVPPTINLPPPQAENIAVNNPAWPKDPDTRTSAGPKKKKARQLNTTEAENESMRQLTAAEMAPGAVQTRRERPDGPAVQNGSQNGPSSARAEQLAPSQLGHEGFTLGGLFGSRDGKEVKFVKEPERQALTDPPIGLRSPSPRYTYGTKGRLDPTKEIGNDQAVFGADK